MKQFLKIGYFSAGFLSSIDASTTSPCKEAAHESVEGRGGRHPAAADTMPLHSCNKTQQTEPAVAFNVCSAHKMPPVRT